MSLGDISFALIKNKKQKTNNKKNTPNNNNNKNPQTNKQRLELRGHVSVLCK